MTSRTATKRKNTVRTKPRTAYQLDVSVFASTERVTSLAASFAAFTYANELDIAEMRATTDAHVNAAASGSTTLVVPPYTSLAMTDVTPFVVGYGTRPDSLTLTFNARCSTVPTDELAAIASVHPGMTLVVGYRRDTGNGRLSSRRSTTIVIREQPAR